MSTTQCGHCGMHHQPQQTCPRIKSIDYYQDGTVKHVEYHPAQMYEPVQYWLNPNYISPKVT